MIVINSRLSQFLPSVTDYDQCDQMFKKIVAQLGEKVAQLKKLQNTYIKAAWKSQNIYIKPLSKNFIQGKK